MTKKWNSQRRQRANEKHQRQLPRKEQRKRDKRKATARAGPVVKHRAWPPSWLLRSMLAATIMEVAMILAIVLRWI